MGLPPLFNMMYKEVWGLRGCCAVPMFADWIEGLAGISQVERFNPMTRLYYLGKRSILNVVADWKGGGNEKARYV